MAKSPGVAVLAKVVPLRVDVDATTGVVTPDPALRGCSDADHAALAIGASLALHHHLALRVVSVGSARDSDTLAKFAARVDCPVTHLVVSGDDGAASRVSSATTARLLAADVEDDQFIVCGDHSLDRGSGSVPARVAEILQRPQALGLLDVNIDASEAVRRVSAGRRERVRFGSGVVLSVEATARRAPRATPSALLADRVTRVDVVAAPDPTPRYVPYRVPAAHVLGPSEVVAARRAMEVIGALTPARAREVLVAEPHDAAVAILDRLHAWGYR